VGHLGGGAGFRGSDRSSRGRLGGGASPPRGYRHYGASGERASSCGRTVHVGRAELDEPFHKAARNDMEPERDRPSQICSICRATASVRYEPDRAVQIYQFSDEAYDQRLLLMNRDRGQQGRVEHCVIAEFQSGDTEPQAKRPRLVNRRSLNRRVSTWSCRPSLSAKTNALALPSPTMRRTAPWHRRNALSDRSTTARRPCEVRYVPPRCWAHLKVASPLWCVGSRVLSSPPR